MFKYLVSHWKFVLRSSCWSLCWSGWSHFGSACLNICPHPPVEVRVKVSGPPVEVRVEVSGIIVEVHAEVSLGSSFLNISVWKFAVWFLSRVCCISWLLRWIMSPSICLQCLNHNISNTSSPYQFSPLVFLFLFCFCVLPASFFFF